MSSWKKFIQYRRLYQHSKQALSFELWFRRLLFWSGAIAVGLVAVGFAIVAEKANEVSNDWFQQFPYLPLALCPLGFMLIIWLKNKFFQGSEGSGIPQVMAALSVKQAASRKHLVSLRIAVGKFLLTVLGFLCGGSIGREGPTIQLSAAVMNSLGRWGSFHRHDVERGLLLAGGAAGISAAFNTPLAGIVFAIEELSGSFEKGISGTIVTTVILGGIISHYILGNYSYFGTSTAILDITAGGWYPIIICAILGGLLGGIFSTLLLSLTWLLRNFARVHPLILAGIMGLLLAIIGVLTHGSIFGSGYQEAKALVTGTGSVSDYYGPLKMLANLVTYLSGIPGGIFAPSLSAGAGFGQLLSLALPDHFHQAVIILGMVAFFSGVVQSPITCFVIVLEMTNSVSGNMILPIMLTSVMATAFSRITCRQPLYHSLAIRYLRKPEIKAGLGLKPSSS
ncbi:H(+)/Cl(-) exchange transporter ClcA [Piscirickettsia salmonis]|uniref:Voltage gated chloride channel family protein n=1 Tax=Piscirickettsia salmonis TaxID=1238 RepID=A0A1L6TFK7_PISSA|nr:chloride channel protein [Piscirickettsia salmonis]AKP72249.1 hypothetical protein PSLF89_29 [Piscirickettsia salmonis LF-89 = ATCC VR-1361]ALB24312.1 voltage gated chloride channel family protein [Piscirickettsia salmonis]AMA43661.1 hypothetical protein AWJ11_15745 [Piscirickettsia salmonis]AOS36128.1 hypothetical protein AVM72_12850 [Piscirickettsia salmonis]APS60826.1 hypothetical protein AVI53_09815 [Piscirickettsia salmonis]